MTARAQRDLAAIYAYIHADFSEHASRWFNGLERTILSLEKQPERGMPVSGHPGVRQLLYGKKPHRYRVFYSAQTKAGVVVVLHIRHGARQKMPKTNE